MARALMFQGTGSDVGKSLLVAGLCRLLARRNMCVMPFKPQNMSNNAAVAQGGEIGRAQWLQALAAGVSPSVHMNPVLLKPEADARSQVIVRGQVTATLPARDYYAWRARLLPVVLESYHILAAQADIVLVEGAGSASEINLRTNDIANMGFARAAACPVVLVGDIDRGGVIASLAGTHTVLASDDRALVRGFLINKFRGDASLFADGAKAIERFTSWPCLGIAPHHAALARLPQEDSLALPCRPTHEGKIHIAVLTWPHIANFDDLDPLAGDPAFRLTWCREGEAIPGDAQWVILPGSKSTLADLAFLRAQGWDIDLKAHLRRGGRILGLCGGFQMLGRTLSDPHCMEGGGRAEGLGLLAVDTVFDTRKTVTPWRGAYHGIPVEGYEIHLGETRSDAESMFDGEGVRSSDGRVWGTYIHGLFAADAFRRAFFHAEGMYDYSADMLRILDGWADVLENTLDINALLAIAAQANRQAVA